MRASREEWRRRVERWGRSGKSAEEFAAAGGFHPATLRHWKYKLRGERRSTSREATSRATTLPLVEVLATTRPSDARFELELASGRRLRVPSSFDGEALRRLLAILEDDDRGTR